MMKQCVLAGAAVALAAMPVAAMKAAPIDLGANDGPFADDGECDDPRLVGEGMASALLTDSIGRDAADCSAALKKGTVSLNPWYVEPASVSDISYGDNASDFAHDGECDDIRFTGDYADAMIYLVEDIGHDADDCRAAVKSGEASWQGAIPNPVRGMNPSDMMDEAAYTVT